MLLLWELVLVFSPERKYPVCWVNALEHLILNFCHSTLKLIGVVGFYLSQPGHLLFTPADFLDKQNVDASREGRALVGRDSQRLKNCHQRNPLATSLASIPQL